MNNNKHWDGYPIWIMVVLNISAVALLASFDLRVGVAYALINMMWAIDSSFTYSRIAKQEDKHE
jgi:hypothetical protein